MLKELSKKTKLDIFITFLATLTSTFFIVLSYLWKDYTTQILSILIIVLPTIYIVGGMIIRGIVDNEFKKVRSSYDNTIQDINEGVEDMQEYIVFLERENGKLIQKIK